MGSMRGRRSISLLACGALAIALAAPAGAGTLEVEFNFDGSTIAILGGFLTVPPDGTITAGSGKLTVNAGSASLPTAGGASLSDLALSGTLSKNSLGVAITGAIGATQPAAAAGQLTGGLAVVNLPSPFLLNFTGFANCTDTGTSTGGCAALSLPTTFTGPRTFTIGALPVGSLANVGNAFVSGTFSFTLGGFTAVLSLVGTEIGRTFIVPEPHTFGLLALGLAALGAHATQRRLRG